MATADQRIVIRDPATGETRHAIEGHILQGWVAIKPVKDEPPKPQK